MLWHIAGHPRLNSGFSITPNDLAIQKNEEQASSTVRVDGCSARLFLLEVNP
jgi:hypothetical protein